MKLKNVLISMFNKEGIENLLKIFSLNEVTIYATESTADYIQNKGYAVKRTEEITGISSMLCGRVKTLNQDLFAGILARRGIDNTDKIPVLFDMVIVDLYPFEETAQSTADENEILEKIDIGGVSLIRAAAKNYKYTAVLCRKEQYEEAEDILGKRNCSTDEKQRKKWANRAFAYTMEYDSAINDYLRNTADSDEDNSRAVILNRGIPLRYGENPHQKAKIYSIKGENSGLMSFKQLHGKAMSYNNYCDTDAALNMISLFDKPAVSIVKHANPCGMAVGSTIEEAYEMAHMTDPKSAYGSIVALNRKCCRNTAQLINSTFVEIVTAPEFDEDALEILTRKKNIRILQGIYGNEHALTYKHINGGMLVQVMDNQRDNEIHYDIVSKRRPTEKEMEAMQFAFSVVRYVKSNGIVIATTQRTLGIGAGQMSRIDAVDIAIRKGGSLAAYTGGAAMASDGFFPFSDSIKKAYKAGIYAVIEPGGSKRDMDIIKACNENDMALVFTGRRHFLH